MKSNLKSKISLKPSIVSAEATGQLKLKKQRNGKPLSRLKSFQKDLASNYHALSLLSRDTPADALIPMGWLAVLNMSLTGLWEVDSYLTTLIEQLECQRIYGKKLQRKKGKSG